MVEDASRGVADIEKNLKQCAMLAVGTDALAEGLRVFEWCERAVDAANNFPERDLSGGTPELIAAFRASGAHNDPRALELEQNGLQELLRQLFLGSDVPDFDYGARMLREHGQGLQSVKSSL